MKNIFKMMGVALLACSMIMVSCKKDDEDTTNNGGGNNGGGNGGNNTPTASYSATWDGQAMTLAVAEGYYYNLGEENSQLAGLEIFQFIGAAGLTSEEYDLPMVQCNAARYNGTYTIAEQLGLGSYFPCAAYVDANEVAWYPQALRANPTFGTFDATNHTFGFDYAVQLYNTEEWNAAFAQVLANDGYTTEDAQEFDDETYASYVTAADALTTMKDITVTVSNVVFTPSTYFNEK